MKEIIVKSIRKSSSMQKRVSEKAEKIIIETESGEIYQFWPEDTGLLNLLSNNMFFQESAWKLALNCLVANKVSFDVLLLSKDFNYKSF